MAALAGFLGWSSHRTIVKVYDATVASLAAQGKPAPPNPFDAKPRLSLLSNMTIYVPLIGALVAILIGHLAIAEDRAAGAGRLIFSRPIARGRYLAGKLAGSTLALVAILAGCLVLSAISLVIVNSSIPGAGDLGRLALFYGLSLAYLLLFALIGMGSALLTPVRSLSLLAAIGVWLVLTFAVPQVTSGLRPTASLNPVSDPVSTSQRFFKVTSHARPFSVSEQYKLASSQILETATPETTGRTLERVAPILGLLGLTGLLAFGLVRRHDYAAEAAGA
jgi:ABC-type transport system involved in multi-copper enzyme maturation permease subunit